MPQSNNNNSEEFFIADKNIASSSPAVCAYADLAGMAIAFVRLMNRLNSRLDSKNKITNPRIGAGQ
jgi:hypothetical protein